METRLSEKALLKRTLKGNGCRIVLRNRYDSNKRCIIRFESKCSGFHNNKRP